MKRGQRLRHRSFCTRNQKVTFIWTAEYFASLAFFYTLVQGDQSGCSPGVVDIKTKIAFYKNNVMGHPVKGRASNVHVLMCILGPRPLRRRTPRTRRA